MNSNFLENFQFTIVFLSFYKEMHFLPYFFKALVIIKFFKKFTLFQDVLLK